MEGDKHSLTDFVLTIRPLRLRVTCLGRDVSTGRTLLRLRPVLVAGLHASEFIESHFHMPEHKGTNKKASLRNRSIALHPLGSRKKLRALTAHTMKRFVRRVVADREKVVDMPSTARIEGS